MTKESTSNERESLIREIKELERLERKSYSYRPSKPSNQNLGILAMVGIFCVSIVAILLHKSDNNKCKC